MCGSLYILILTFSEEHSHISNGETKGSNVIKIGTANNKIQILNPLNHPLIHGEHSTKMKKLEEPTPTKKTIPKAPHIYSQMCLFSSLHPQIGGEYHQQVSQFASVYNNNLEKIRYQLRKLVYEQGLKKSLSRPMLSSGLGNIYKPSAQFFHNLNNVDQEKSQDKTDKSAQPQTHNNAISQKYSANYKEMNGNIVLNNRIKIPPHVPASQSNFVCEVCKRGYPLAKKYAKNQRQTCYKKMKKRQIRDENMEGVIIKRPESSDKMLSPRGVREWSGRCPTCQREGVKHYARGCCTMCYRKEMKKLKRMRQEGNGHDGLNSSNDSIQSFN